MNKMSVFDDKTKLAESAAKQTIAILKSAIDANGNATWVLSGGATPLLAYKIIAANYDDAIDWSKVTVLMGDERIGPLDGPDNNWYAIDQIIGDLPTTKLCPQSDKSAEDAADDYARQLASLPKTDNDRPRFDLIWLGVGKDGHTLSIFPGHHSLLPTSNLVIPVHDSPKAPRDRISLSLRALQGTVNVMVIASGADKQVEVAAAQKGGSSPIALALSIIATHEGRITWLVDRDAAPTD